MLHGALKQHAAAAAAGLIQPELLADGQVCVDMGEPILDGPKVPTTLPPTQVWMRRNRLHSSMTRLAIGRGQECGGEWGDERGLVCGVCDGGTA